MAKLIKEAPIKQEAAAAKTAEAAEGAAKKMKIQLVRSPIGYEKRQKETVKTLGLRRMHQIIEKPDTPAMRAMVNAVSHMVVIVE